VELRGQAGNLQTGLLFFQITIAQLNQAQKVVKPADVRPIAELRSALTDLGLISASSAAPASTTVPDTTATPTPETTATTPSAAADPQADYAQCIADAGEDLAKVQDCAQYLDK
jgi:hypothetical protein